MFSFQTIFQYIFNCSMCDLAERIASTQCFVLEFENVGINWLMSVKFWKGDSLCRVFICRSGLLSTDLNRELGVACSECPVELIQTIDHSDYLSRAVQSCFRFEHLRLQTMMHKPTYSLFGRIDFFSVLKSLIVSLGAATGEDWVLQSPDLAQVSILHSLVR